MQWQMVSVDQRMRKAFRRFVYTGTATWLEQAFIYTILAIVGKVTCDTNICTQARYIRDVNVQKQYIEMASLVMEVEDNTMDDAAKINGHHSDQPLKAQIECLRAFYAILLNDAIGALKQFDKSTQYAEQAGVLDCSAHMMQESERSAMKRFAVELAVPAIWVSIINGQAPPTVFEHLTEYKASPYDEPVEVEILQFKVIGIGILINTQRILSDAGPITLEKAREILQIDNVITNRLDRPGIRFAREFRGHYITDTVNYRKLFTSNAIHQTHLSLRCALLQKLCSVSIASSSYSKLLEVANESLQETKNTWIVLQAPWHKIGRMAKTPMHAEIAMSVFASALDSSDYLASSRRVPLGKRSRNTTTMSQVADFVDNFDRTYNLLNTLGLLTPSTLKCAQMIKMVPIKPSLSLITNTELDRQLDHTTPTPHAEAASITEISEEFGELPDIDVAVFSEVLYDLLQKGFEIDTTEAFLHSLNAM